MASILPFAAFFSNDRLAPAPSVGRSAGFCFSVVTKKSVLSDIDMYIWAKEGGQDKTVALDLGAMPAQWRSAETDPEYHADTGGRGHGKRAPEHDTRCALDQPCTAHDSPKRAQYGKCDQRGQRDQKTDLPVSG